MILIRTISYQREVDKGKLTAIASLKKVDVSSMSPLSEKIICSDEGLTLETSAFFKLATAVNLPLSTSR